MWADIFGHERIKAVLSRALERGRLAPALLFVGPEGVGKKRTALALAAALVCEQRSGCGACSACGRLRRSLALLPERRARAFKEESQQLYDHRLHPDVMLVEPNLPPPQPAIRIEQVRDVVQELVGRPFEAAARAFVVDSAHLMNEAAQNAFLKGLEEPPPYVHLVLVTSSPQTLLPTIRSRCQVLRFGPLPIRLVAEHLEREHGLAADEATLRATMAGGSLGAALAFHTDAFKQSREAALRLLEELPKNSPVERQQHVQRIAEETDPVASLSTLRALLRDVATLRAGGAARHLLNADVAERLATLARGSLGAAAGRMAEAVQEARVALRANANKLLALDAMLDAMAAALARQT